MMQLQNVTFAYRAGEPVVEGVSADVHPGRVHALIGPNGCGKTTLLKIMLGEYRPLTGSVTVDGRCVHRLPAAQRAAWISYVPQRSVAAFTFSVRQVVAMARFAVGDDEAAVGEALAACDLKGLQDKPFMELSIGQQQRVLLARAMAQAAGHGRLMFLDEPTSAMDLLHLHTTLSLVRAMAERGMGVVMVMQELNLRLATPTACG